MHIEPREFEEKNIDHRPLNLFRLFHIFKRIKKFQLDNLENGNSALPVYFW